MRKGVMALEGLEQDPIDETPEVSIDSAMVETASSVDEIINSEAAISEAQGISDSVGEIADVAEASIESGEGLPEEAAVIANVTLEHFYTRLGYTAQKGRAKVSLEGYDKPGARLKATKAALESIRTFQPKLDKSLAVAQEGFFSNISNSLGYFFSTRKKMLAQLKLAVTDYNNGVPRTDPIEEPRWGRKLNPKNARMVKGGDVIALAQGAAKESKIFSLVSEALDAAEAIGAALTDSTFIANDASVKKIKEKHNVLMRLMGEIDSLLPNLGEKGADASFQPLNPGEVKKLASVLDDLLSSKELEALGKKLSGKAGQIGFSISTQGQFLRAAGLFAADLRAAMSSLREMNALAAKALTAANDNLKISHSAVQYIAASAAK